jgi:hypothetical protein
MQPRHLGGRRRGRPPAARRRPGGPAGRGRATAAASGPSAAGVQPPHPTANAREATPPGITPVVGPPPGATAANRSAPAPPRGCRRGHHGRAGLEGRLRGLTRRHRPDRGREQGPAGMDRWGGWGALAHKLRVSAPAPAPEPGGEALLPGAGLRPSATWGGQTALHRVLHRNLGLGSTLYNVEIRKGHRQRSLSERGGETAIEPRGRWLCPSLNPS